MQPHILRNFINVCTLTFKTFDFEVIMSQNKSVLWNFVATSSRTPDKKYAVMCAPDFAKSKALLKVALKKMANDQRLVLVTSSYTDEDLETAREQNFCLVSIAELKKYGDEMLEAREREAKLNNNEEGKSFVDQVISKDNLF